MYFVPILTIGTEFAMNRLGYRARLSLGEGKVDMS